MDPTVARAYAHSNDPRDPTATGWGRPARRRRKMRTEKVNLPRETLDE